MDASRRRSAYNDTQDMEFMYTWAILPQAMYPLDLRASNIAHDGGDIYGEIPLKKAGSISYTAYAGMRIIDKTSGTYYSAADNGVPIKSFSGRTEGFDAKWNTKVQGLLVGYSFGNLRQNVGITDTMLYNLPLTAVTNPQHVNAVYGDYVRGKLHLSTEFRHNHETLDIGVAGTQSTSNFSDMGWFGAISYKLTSRIEVGAYNSRYYIAAPTVPTDPNANHIFDQVATVRFDVRKWWNVKLEGHFINGYGDLYSAHGFYLRSNPTGTKPTTDMLVIRTAFTF